MIYSPQAQQSAMKAELNDHIEAYGGKGAGLYFLQQICVHINALLKDYHVVTPPFTVCKQSNSIRGSMSHIPYTGDRNAKFAVRSSGSVSMPGLMETVLNVRVGDVSEQIAKIRDSFSAEEAQNFLKSIPEGKRPTGIAVVVQEMVEADFYGVIFTVGPAGYGDHVISVTSAPKEIVGGEIDGGEMTLPDTIIQAITKISDSWMSITGEPPELEFGYDVKEKTLYLFQIRNQRLTEQDKLALKGYRLDVVGGEVVGEVEGFGFAKVESIDDVVFLPSANPEKVSSVIYLKHPALIVWQKGSLVSHGAVLCRTAGIAYARGTQEDFPSIDDFVFSNGKIYAGEAIKVRKVPDEKRLAIFEAKNKIRWDLYDLFLSEDPDDWEPFIVISLKEMALNTLIGWKLHLYEFVPEAAIEFGQAIAILSAIAEIGEARHMPRWDNAQDPNIKRMMDWVPSESDRAPAYRKITIRQRGIVDALPILREAFQYREGEHRLFTSGYGNRPWAAITGKTIKLISVLKKLREATTVSASYSAFVRMVRLLNQIERMEHNNTVWTDKFIPSPKKILDRFSYSVNFGAFLSNIMSVSQSIEPSRTFYVAHAGRMLNDTVIMAMDEDDEGIKIFRKAEDD